MASRECNDAKSGFHAGAEFKRLPKSKTVFSFDTAGSVAKTSIACGLCVALRFDALAAKADAVEETSTIDPSRASAIRPAPGTNANARGPSCNEQQCRGSGFAWEKSNTAAPELFTPRRRRTAIAMVACLK